MGDEINIQDKKFALREVFEALEYSMTVFDNATCFKESDRDFPKAQALYNCISTLYSSVQNYMNEL